VLFDLPLSELRVYKPDREEPADFDSFWADTLADARSHPLAPSSRSTPGLATVDVWDVTFAGFGGQPIKGWFLAPHDVGRLAVREETAGCRAWSSTSATAAAAAGRSTGCFRRAPATPISSWTSAARAARGVRRHPGSGVRRRNRPVPRLRHARHHGPGDLLLPPPHDRRGPGRRGRPRHPLVDPGASPSTAAARAAAWRWRRPASCRICCSP
jgi:hypothetical protein